MKYGTDYNYNSIIIECGGRGCVCECDGDSVRCDSPYPPGAPHPPGGPVKGVCVANEG